MADTNFSYVLVDGGIIVPEDPGSYRGRVYAQDPALVESHGRYVDETRTPHLQGEASGYGQLFDHFSVKIPCQVGQRLWVVSDVTGLPEGGGPSFMHVGSFVVGFLENGDYVYEDNPTWRPGVMYYHIHLQ